jgi:hypothetical protein
MARDGYRWPPGAETQVAVGIWRRSVCALAGPVVAPVPDVDQRPAGGPRRHRNRRHAAHRVAADVTFVGGLRERITAGRIVGARVLASDDGTIRRLGKKAQRDALVATCQHGGAHSIEHFDADHEREARLLHETAAL